MSERLDHLLEQLAASAAERPPQGLESAVMRRIDRLRADRESVAAMAPFRIAAVALALVIGAATGGLAAAATLGGPDRLGAFSEVQPLAPSTLLGDAR